MPDRANSVLVSANVPVTLIGVPKRNKTVSLFSALNRPEICSVFKSRTVSPATVIRSVSASIKLLCMIPSLISKRHTAQFRSVTSFSNQVVGIRSLTRLPPHNSSSRLGIRPLSVTISRSPFALPSNSRRLNPCPFKPNFKFSVPTTSLAISISFKIKP